MKRDVLVIIAVVLVLAGSGFADVSWIPGISWRFFCPKASHLRASPRHLPSRDTLFWVLHTSVEQPIRFESKSNDSQKPGVGGH